MGWAYHNKLQRPWSDEDLQNPLVRRLAAGGVAGVYRRPPTRDLEGNARTRALREIGYRDGIDQDGYPCDGPGADPGRFTAGPRSDGGDSRSFRTTAWCAAAFDGGWDGDDDGEGPLVEWLDHRNQDRGGR